MSKPTITLYGAVWCANCKMVKPLLEMIGEVEYIDIDENIEAAQTDGVKSLPTFINKANGQRGTGVYPVAKLREILGIEA